MALLQQMLPYLLPMVLLALNEIIAHNDKIDAKSLLGLVLSTCVNVVKAAIGANPPKPLP